MTPTDAARLITDMKPSGAKQFLIREHGPDIARALLDAEERNANLKGILRGWPVSEQEIDAMLNEIDWLSKQMTGLSMALPTHKAGREEVREIVRERLRIKPLPTVPTDATCGGCRYYVLINESTQTMCCGLEPRFEERSVWHKACRHYQEAAK